jgi:hypothetical protein
MAAGALVVTHTISNNQAVTLGNEQTAVTNVDDLLHFLEAHAILGGGSNR